MVSSRLGTARAFVEHVLFNGWLVERHYRAEKPPLSHRTCNVEHLVLVYLVSLTLLLSKSTKADTDFIERYLRKSMLSHIA